MLAHQTALDRPLQLHAVVAIPVARAHRNPVDALHVDQVAREDATRAVRMFAAKVANQVAVMRVLKIVDKIAMGLAKGNLSICKAVMIVTVLVWELVKVAKIHATHHAGKEVRPTLISIRQKK